MRRIARTAADGVGAREWLEMGGEKKQPLVMSELGCADGCGREKGAENCADGCGWRGCNGVAGNYGCGEEAAGDERAWLRGRLRTANGWGEMRGRLRTAWVPGSGWKWVGRRSRWRSASLAARTAADGKWVRRIARTAADGVGAREWLEMGGEKKALVMSERGCADGCGRRGCNGVAGNGWREDAAGDERAWLRGGCGRQMGAENYCADGCGRRGCKGVAGNVWGEEAMGMSELGCADGCGRERGAENCADSRGRRGCKGVAGNGLGEEAAGDERAWLRGRLWTANGWGEWRGCKGVAGNVWGEEAAGDERAWLHGRLRTGTGCGELRGWLRTAWVQGSGWKWVGRRTRCSPRTRMLTRMLMDMQSLRTIFCNSLFEQSCIYIFPLLPVCSVERTV